jgi:enoyl-CoA hydratase
LGSESAVFAQPEVGLGIIPGAGAIYRLPKIIGRGLAREMIFSALRLDAESARDRGLLNYRVPETELEPLTQKIVRRILKQEKRAVSLAKGLMAFDDDEKDSQKSILAQAILFESPEKRERMKAFLKKQGKRT